MKGTRAVLALCAQVQVWINSLSLIRFYFCPYPLLISAGQTLLKLVRDVDGQFPQSSLLDQVQPSHMLHLVVHRVHSLSLTLPLCFSGWRGRVGSPHESVWGF